VLCTTKKFCWRLKHPDAPIRARVQTDPDTSGADSQVSVLVTWEIGEGVTGRDGKESGPIRFDEFLAATRNR